MKALGGGDEGDEAETIFKEDADTIYKILKRMMTEVTKRTKIRLKDISTGKTWFYSALENNHPLLILNAIRMLYDDKADHGENNVKDLLVEYKRITSSEELELYNAYHLFPKLLEGKKELDSLHNKIQRRKEAINNPFQPSKNQHDPFLEQLYIRAQEICEVYTSEVKTSFSIIKSAIKILPQLEGKYIEQIKACQESGNKPGRAINNLYYGTYAKLVKEEIASIREELCERLYSFCYVPGETKPWFNSNLALEVLRMVPENSPKYHYAQARIMHILSHEEPNKEKSIGTTTASIQSLDVEELTPQEQEEQRRRAILETFLNSYEIRDCNVGGMATTAAAAHPQSSSSSTAAANALMASAELNRVLFSKIGLAYVVGSSMEPNIAEHRTIQSTLLAMFDRFNTHAKTLGKKLRNQSLAFEKQTEELKLKTEELKKAEQQLVGLRAKLSEQSESSLDNTSAKKRGSKRTWDADKPKEAVGERASPLSSVVSTAAATTAAAAAPPAAYLPSALAATTALAATPAAAAAATAAAALGEAGSNGSAKRPKISASSHSQTKKTN